LVGFEAKSRLRRFFGALHFDRGSQMGTGEPSGAMDRKA
jgi:hypothetical protein